MEVITIKVMHVGEYVNGGVATYIKELFDYQIDSGEISEVIILLNFEHSDKALIEYTNVYSYDYKRSFKNFIKAIYQINNYIKRIDPDIIHIHSTFAGLFVRFLYFFKRKRAKIIYCSHGWAFLMDIPFIKKKFYGLVEKILSIKTDKIINISEHEYESSLKYGIPKKKSRVIYNGVRPSNITQLPDVGLNHNKINLLFVGRFDRQKGLDILITFFKKYKLDNINLYLIGSKVLGDQTITVPNNIINLGWINNNDMDSYYQLFDAVIIPSRWEGFGLVAIEAMKNGKAVISSNRGALSEIVVENVTGYLFDIENDQSLLKILKLIRKSDLARLGNQGYRRYQEMFTSTKMNEEILNLYKDVL